MGLVSDSRVRDEKHIPLERRRSDFYWRRGRRRVLLVSWCEAQEDLHPDQ